MKKIRRKDQYRDGKESGRLYFGFKVLGFKDLTPIVDNQMEKRMETDMKTGNVYGSSCQQ